MTILREDIEYGRVFRNKLTYIALSAIASILILVRLFLWRRRKK